MNNENKIKFPGSLSCPIPKSDYDRILLAHGGGGTLSHKLISKLFYPQFANDILDQQHDSGVFELNGSRIALTTDSYVIHPIFFPGGDIGSLAINGTINDLSMAGAKPLFISAAFIIEEGFEIEELWKIVLSMEKAAKDAGVKIITGDTKVVDKGKGDKIFINTSGIGIVPEGVNISPKNCQPGDVIILSGKIAEHGVAIMSSRENLEFETTIKSDSAPLNGLVEKMLNASKEIHVMRDPTRGGVASTLNEIAMTAKVGILIEEEKIPISEEVKGACEILGLDPLYIANEGKLIAFISENSSEEVLEAMRSHPLGREACIIGKVTSTNPEDVIMKTSIGSTRIVDMMSGEQLPRIC